MDDCILQLIQISIQIDHIDENDFWSRSVEGGGRDDDIDSGKCATLDLGIGVFPDNLYAVGKFPGNLHFDQLAHGLAAAANDGNLLFTDGLFAVSFDSSSQMQGDIADFIFG